ncbi:HNH endonuclease [Raoultella ornithinolytica]|uniref:HNH endonuclease n=1 Tax=Raoultella ornithinolytica TaxID=54291 RepID=UPI0021BB1C62|nr:HNH endonuclease [Raoultella ornithinolytica]MCT8168558.1 HNH endonuclease [Raoultella ornithinolytica]
MEWKQINDKYSINSNGQIWSNRREQYLKLTTNPNGYVMIPKSIRVDYKYVHQLMLAIFEVPKPDDEQLYTPDHINRNEEDNRLVNLRWATRTEQQLNQKVRKTQEKHLEFHQWRDLMNEFLTGQYSHYQITDYMNDTYGRNSHRIVYMCIIKGQHYKDWYEGYLTDEQRETIKVLNAARKTY